MKKTFRQKTEELIIQYKLYKDQAQDRMHESSLKGDWEQARMYDGNAKSYGVFIDDLKELLVN